MNGITVNIEEILETVEAVYDNWHEIRFNCHRQAFIKDPAGKLVDAFNSLDDLCRWIVDRQAELDEKDVEQSAINDKINAKSANVDIMNKLW